MHSTDSALSKTNIWRTMNLPQNFFKYFIACDRQYLLHGAECNIGNFSEFLIFYEPLGG